MKLKRERRIANFHAFTGTPLYARKGNQANNMKKLIWKIVLPLTLIVFSTISMWRYVLTIDGPDEILTGFPLPYICPGWHTSFSYQIFIRELLFDFLIYFALCFLIVFLINKFIWKFRTNIVITIILYLVSGFLIADPTYILGFGTHVYKISRDFKIKTLETGIKFRYKNIDRPELSKYVLIQEDFAKQLDFTWNNLTNKNDFQIKYIQQAGDPFLGFSPTRRIEEVNFIDSVIVLNNIESVRLLRIISDSLNFEKNKCEGDRFFVHSGFIISLKDTIHGAVHMTYDLDCIEFTPGLRSSTSWTLTEKGKKTLKDFIIEIKKTMKR
jgi:hypothetical protein